MVRLIIWIVIGLLALSFFGISLEALVENPTNQSNVSYVLHLVGEGWDAILDWFRELAGSFQKGS